MGLNREGSQLTYSRLNPVLDVYGNFERDIAGHVCIENLNSNA